MRKFAFLLIFLCAPVLFAQTAVSIAPTARQQFFDAAGVPLAGGLIYTYASGTSTPQATYADYTGTTQNTNPIVLDSGGMAQIWLASGETYRFVAKDSNGVQQWLVDGVIGSPNLLSPGPIGTTTPNVVEATYLLTSTSTPALSGFMRLASNDQICWRNNANSADFCISKNTADQILIGSAGIGANGIVFPTRATGNITWTDTSGTGPCVGACAQLSEDGDGSLMLNRELRLHINSTYTYPALFGCNGVDNVNTARCLASDDVADTNNEFYLQINGKMAWGPGNATQDTDLQRAQNGFLDTDSSFVAGQKIGAGFGSIPLSFTPAGTFEAHQGANLNFLATLDTNSHASLQFVNDADNAFVNGYYWANEHHFEHGPVFLDTLGTGCLNVTTGQVGTTSTPCGYTNSGTTTSAGTCPTTATAFATCTVSVPLARTEADTAYAATCTVAAVSTGDPWVKSITKGTSSITVLISNLSSTGATASTPAETDCTVTR